MYFFLPRFCLRRPHSREEIVFALLIATPLAHQFTLPFAGHEGERWEIEQRQLHERHQLARTQLKETFFLQRSQMLNRHQKVSCIS